MVGESCFEGVLCKTDVGLRWFVVICFDRCLVDYGRTGRTLTFNCLYRKIKVLQKVYRTFN